MVDLGPIVSADGLSRMLLRACIMYVFAVLLLRLTGKRTTTSLTAFDFITSVMMGTMAASTVISASVPLLGGMAALAAVVGLQTVTAFLSSRSDRFLHVIASQPVILYYDSQYIDENLRQARISRSQVEQKMRSAGHSSSQEVLAVVLESAGTISVISNGNAHQPGGENLVPGKQAPPGSSAGARRR